jgi:uncharacterized protein YjbI with pentapeptide repeats
MKFTIKSRNNSVLFEVEADSFVKAVEQKKANLYGANLSEANLYGANLSGANLTRADLTRANLSEANLTGADLTRADLTEADLTRADLTGADLTGADLTRADLTRADLYGANLTRADLTRADLYGANLYGQDLTKTHYQVSQILHGYNWGDLPDNLTLELMRRDAIICGNDKMDKWAHGGDCPFMGYIVRDFYFTERDLWEPGAPTMNDMELFKALCKEKEIKIC